MLIIAEIPLLDWRGPQFLAFYASAFVIALLWSLIRARRRNATFEGCPPTSLEDPYEVAMLAGGRGRAMQVAVMRLLELGLIRMEKEGAGARIHAIADAAAVPTAAIEDTLLEAVRNKGESGMPISELPRLVCHQLTAIEVSLASAGLRPTDREHRERKWLTCTPLMILFGLGCVKLALGICRDRPVMFLMLCLFATFMTIYLVVLTTPRLTKAGRNILERLRQQDFQSAGHPACGGERLDWLTLGFALSGAAALFGVPELRADMAHLERTRAIGGGDSSSGSDSGGSGCSSGDSGGGSCGGGGCGGCGGD